MYRIVTDTLNGAVAWPLLTDYLIAKKIICCSFKFGSLLTSDYSAEEAPIVYKAFPERQAYTSTKGD